MALGSPYWEIRYAEVEKVLKEERRAVRRALRIRDMTDRINGGDGDGDGDCVPDERLKD